jgi:hypothetical protein
MELLPETPESTRMVVRVFGVEGGDVDGFMEMFTALTMGEDGAVIENIQRNIRNPLDSERFGFDREIETALEGCSDPGPMVPPERRDARRVLPPLQRSREAVDVADRRVVDVGHHRRALGVSAVVRAVDGAAHRRDAGRRQPARVDESFVA